MLRHARRFFSTTKDSFYQRVDFENKIKLLAQKLSAATPATDLTSLLSFSVRMERHDLSSRALKLFTPQRLGETTDEELAELMASMILLPPEENIDQMWSTTQFIVLRRSH